MSGTATKGTAEKMDDREVEILTIMRRCRFFNGIQNDKCEAGISYRDLVGGEDFGWALGIPCLGDKTSDGTRWPGKNKRQVVQCVLMDTPSREKAEREVDEQRAHTADVLRRLEAGEDVPGVIVCGRRTQPEGHQCPQSEDGKCTECGGQLEPCYGLGSGYGGIGGYDFCVECFTVHNFAEDTGE